MATTFPLPSVLGSYNKATRKHVEVPVIHRVVLVDLPADKPGMALVEIVSVSDARDAGRVGTTRWTARTLVPAEVIAEFEAAR